MLKDYYKILGVSNDANFIRIRHNYIKKIMPCHPGNNPNKLEEFHLINEAFYVLRYSENRGMYNRFYVKDEFITDEYIEKKMKYWHKKSMKKSMKGAKMSYNDFFKEIPKQEGKSDAFLYVAIEFVINVFSI